MTALRAAGIDVDLGGRAVLRGVDFAVAAGELVAVIGPNGAGKSTLARVLAGVLAPHRGRVMLAQASIHGGAGNDGRVRTTVDAGVRQHDPVDVAGIPHGRVAAGVRQHDPVDGATLPPHRRGAAGLRQHDLVDVADIRPGVRARAIGYLPQGAGLAWPLTVARLVGLGRLPHLAPLSRIGAADAAAIDAAMARADVTHLRDRIATELSGGERARALLARALAVGAPVLIADEPLAALDPGHALGVLDVLRAEAARGVAVVAVMHELTLAARAADRLVLLDGGRVVADGPPAAVLDAATLARVYGVTAWHGDADGEALIVPLRRTRV